MKSHLQVLIVEDVEDDLLLLLRELRRSDYTLDYVRVETADAMQAALDRQSWDIVIADYSLPSFSAPDALKLLQARHLDLPFVIVSGTIGEEVAVAAMKAGAHDYIIKGNLTRLIPAIERELRDATERQSRQVAEQALRDSEARFRSLAAELHILSDALESAVEGIAQLDTHGHYIKVNAAYARLVGYQPEEMVGMAWERTVHSAEQAKMAAAYQYMLRHGKVEIETTGIRKDGSSFYKQLVMVTTYDRERQSIGHYCFAKDITERRQNEQIILEQAALLNVATDAISVRDLEHHILFWNQGAERLYGWTASEAVGMSAIDLLNHPDEILPPFATIQTVLMVTGQWQGELSHITKADKKIVVESRWTLVRDNAGNPRSILTVSTDITEKKLLEAQFRRAQRMESLGTLSSGIAHDFNNLLTPILAAAQLLPLRLPDLALQDRHMIEMVETSAKRGADLVKQILAFASGVEGERVSLQVRHLLAEVLQVVRQTFPKTIDIQRNIPATDLWAVSADATQLHQVFMNLCVNARDAMPNGGSLSVSVKNKFLDPDYARINLEAHTGTYVSISISDTGMGIPAELIDRIFDPFFTTKPVGKGTGLGLSTVLGIVKNHGGFVKVESQVGRGTRFKVYLPAISDPIGSADLVSTQSPSGTQETILIVDDEVAIQEVTSTVLDTFNYKTITTSSGAEAIDIYTQRHQEIQVVLMDVMMPNMDGITAARRLQQINPQVKLIFASGLLPSDRVAQIAELGVSAFLSKPYTAQELLDKLQEVLLGELRVADARSSGSPTG
jgi:two-component system, cell cycle sensor histidine kinase and response regulator CckA